METHDIIEVFKQSNLVIIFWFLAIYFVIYFLLLIFRGTKDANNKVSLWVDVITLILFFIYLMYSYFWQSTEEKERILSNSYDTFVSYLESYLSLFSVGFFIITMYIVIYILEIPMNDADKPIVIHLVENFAWLFFVLILISTFIHFSFPYFRLKDTLNNSMSYNNIFNGKFNVDTTQGGNGNGNSKSAASTTIIEQNEVFNIGNNMYTYDDAKSVCESLGCRLATYDDIEEAYHKGAEWCSYGWSEGQAAYFPTQKRTWSEMQKSESTKNACGRPGINGGYISNPNTRYGVNCYGKKPKPKPSDINALGTGINVPKTPEDMILEKKIEFWKANSDKLFQINSYNNDHWSMY